MITIYKGFYLVELQGETVTANDGSHSRKSGVTKALELYNRLGFKKTNATYHMIKVNETVSTELKPDQYFTALLRNDSNLLQPVVNKKVKLNESAIKQLNKVMGDKRNGN